MHLSLASVLAESARCHPDRVALVDGEARLTYAQIWTESLRHASALRELGIGPGDRVALLAGNVADFVRCYYGVLAAGGTIVPVPPMLTPAEAAHLVSDSGARLVIGWGDYADLAARAAQQAGVPVRTVGVADSPDALEPLVERSAPLAAAVSREPDDIAVIFYTSGTTGRPKGALLSHLNLVMNATVNAFDSHPMQRGDVVLGCLPLFHTFGQTVALNTTFRAGATLVLQHRFDPDQAIALMRAENVSNFLGVPTMFVHLAEAAQRHRELPSLRICISGGASLPVAVLHRFEKAFGTEVYEGYGLSETSPTASVNQPAFGARAGTVGHPIWGVEVEIAAAGIDDRIELLAPGEQGEIVVRGHNVFAGYLNNPEATAEALVEGWFRTGDIGVKDGDGFISIVDRKKDLIIRGGYNVYPREIEEVLSEYPDVAQVAVIGVPHRELGEETCAVVVPAAGAEIVAEELLAWGRERLAGHKYPRRVEIVAELPLGPSHKVLKRELRARFHQEGRE
ncbi:long-chain acyl-CoA synthetase [Spinactinospora alkalitolerans]|uniref:Long-chain acyl-CoA synthetase n=1 Tax=Spinactinospora alkalitolerans TaxID=687207 RepID=A0A852TRA8_9ACTN|nr:long-chain fatty acid--CoA ligase [Spinactinospora alkalitolerans]NYE46498.1 long-chain acyl-CoA synthetase [Spinactinospora alkalitolerans]